ncbi:immunity protein TriTu family protein [Marinobacter nauticus]|uniref:immunity protein TriTu family protein n=2 Tax=Marinobacter TaxID=2742 RepID=UPI003511D16E
MGEADRYYAALRPGSLPKALCFTMNELLAYLEQWKSSKSKIFGAEGYAVSITGELGDTVKSRYIEIDGNGLLGRATLWESGSLVVEAIDVETEKQILQKAFETPEKWQLDDKLNWWLSEIATYEA